MDRALGCGGHLCVHVQRYMKVKGQPPESCLVTLHLHCESRYFINRVGSKSQGFAFLCVIITGTSDTCHSALLLSGCWSFELMHSCFEDKASTLLRSHL